MKIISEYAVTRAELRIDLRIGDYWNRMEQVWFLGACKLLKRWWPRTELVGITQSLYRFQVCTSIPSWILGPSRRANGFIAGAFIVLNALSLPYRLELVHSAA